MLSGVVVPTGGCESTPPPLGLLLLESTSTLSEFEMQDRALL